MNGTNAACLSPEERRQRTEYNQLSSPLLHLPAELRNHIYIYAFHGALVKADVRHAWMFQPPDEPEIHDTYGSSKGDSLLHVCRQIRHEAGDLIYYHCTFDFDNALFNVDYADNPKFAAGLARYANVRYLRISMQTALGWHSLRRSRMYTVKLNRIPNFAKIFPVLERCYVDCSKWRSSKDCEEIKGAVRTVLGNSTIEVHLEGALCD
ncbi:hypothetical protein NX059_008888 [Plenodomus lindquistii]|nr:hypothetical protein NX059_008888 [Plenodomus lindquistii]